MIEAQETRLDQAAGVQTAQLDAVQKNNDLTDETNDQLAVANAKLVTISDTLNALLLAGQNNALDLASTMRAAVV